MTCLTSTFFLYVKLKSSIKLEEFMIIYDKPFHTSLRQSFLKLKHKDDRYISITNWVFLFWSQNILLSLFKKKEANFVYSEKNSNGCVVLY